MTTSNKDFKVKNGLVVGAGGTFTGTVQASDPVEPQDLVTKAHFEIDNLGGLSLDTPEIDDILIYDGENWVNSSVSSLNVGGKDPMPDIMMMMGA